MNKFCKILYVILVSLIIASCGGGGGGDSGSGSSGNQAPVVSASSALPSQLVSVTHSSIKADDIVDVTFETDGAQTTAVNEETPVVTVKGIADIDGSVDVAVPTFFDVNGLPVERDVHVLVNGIPSATLLHIEALPELPVATGGAVLEAFLSVSINYYENALDNIDEIVDQLGGAVDPADVQASIEAQIQDLEDQLFELEVLGTHTVVFDGVDTVLTQQELETLDHWLLYSLVSIDVASDVTIGNVVVAADQPGTAQVLRDAWNRAVAALQQEQQNSGNVREGTRGFVTEGVPDVLNKAKEAARKGTTYLFGFLSLLTTGAGALGDEALGIAASARNMANAQLSAFLSSINAYLADQNTDSFLGDDSEGFSWGQEMLSQGVRLATAYLGGLQDKLGKASGYVNTGLSVKDMLTEAQVKLCDVLDALASICTGKASGFTIFLYRNFDGTTKDSNGSTVIDPQEADIKLSGNPSRPTISWPGANAIGLVVVDATNIVQVYGIASEQDDNGDLVSFGSPVTYGDYSIPFTSVEGESPAPSLQPGIFYDIFVQRNDAALSGASLIVQVN